MEEELTKKEKRELAKEEKRKERVGDELKSKSKKIFIWIFVLVILSGGGWWLYRGINRPFPGQKLEGLGRKHVKDGTEVEYNSNPPTSGDHYANWTRAGVYGEPIADGNLVHSLEHGYVIISYRCGEGEDCSDLVVKLTQIYEKKGKRKLIVIPRPGLDTEIALTAWARIDKIGKFDEQRIIDFIDSYRNRGPEQTNE